MSFFSLLGRLACQCAKKARDKGYKVFGLQFYGECWSDENGLQTYQKFGKANDKKCIMDLLYKNNQYEWKYCDKASDQPCIGEDSTNYVYVLNEGSVSVKISLPGPIYICLGHCLAFKILSYFFPSVVLAPTLSAVLSCYRKA